MGKVTLAIDLGGTNTKMGLVDSDLNLIAEKSILTLGKLGPEQATAQWISTALEWKKNHSLDLIGIGSPGPLDSDKGIILTTPNLSSWANFPITKTLSDKLGVPCFIENDANCAVLGEFAQCKIPDLVMITLGTGVGCGVISDGNLIRGVKGLGVEAGHTVIDPNGPLCGCGRHGCLEAFVGGRLFVAKYNEKSKDKIPELHAHLIFERAKKGDAIAQDLVYSWTKHLAIGVGNFINIFNPSRVTLTGGLSAAYHEIKTTFNEILLRESFEPSLKCCEVVVSQLQERAAILGAAIWARQQNSR